MTSRRKPAGPVECSRVHGALRLLKVAEESVKQATEWLVLAGCPRASRRALDALRAVYAAQSSAKGAKRHVEHRAMNTERAAEKHGQRQLDLTRAVVVPGDYDKAELAKLIGVEATDA